MPRLYTRLEDEIRIYINRKPKRDGGEPGLLWPVINAIFVTGVILFLFVPLLALMFLTPDFNPNEISLFPNFGILLVLYALVVRFLRTKIFISRRTGRVTTGFLLRSRVGDFDEFSSVRLEGLGGAMWFALVWKDKFKKPVRISPAVRDHRRLDMFYYHIIPLVTEYMELPAFGADLNTEEAVKEIPEEPAVAVVAVDEVEVPLDEAELYLGPTGRDGRKYDYFVLNKKTGLYSGKMKAAEIMMVVLAISFIVGWGWAAMYFDSLIFQVMWIITAVFVPIGLRAESVTFRLDPLHREIINYTHFGLKKTKFRMDELTKITHVEVLHLRAIMLHFTTTGTHPVSVVEDRTIEGVRKGLREFGEIMGLDAEARLE